MRQEQFTALIQLIAAIAKREIELDKDGYACRDTDDMVKRLYETAHTFIVDNPITNSAGSETSPDARARPDAL